MRKRGRQRDDFDGAGRLAAAIGDHPREFVGIVMATVAIFAIFINALFLQHGPHPAPIYAARPALIQETPIAQPRPRMVESAPVSIPAPIAAPAPVVRSQAQIIGDIQRELTRKGFYDSAADGIWGAKTDAATRDFVQAAGLKINVEAGEPLLRAITSSTMVAQKKAAPTRNDPIAQLIAPSNQVLAVQRALSDFGYGQLKPTGVIDPATRAAIEKFERDRRLPVTGQLSEPLIREIAVMTGRPLE
ncbi:MAG TPA: peptidoglycan-binding domain-containing protein [Pseudolabrys sp.]